MGDSIKNESKAIGGRARAEALTFEQRSEIAKKGAVARWGPEVLQATHKGNFKDEFGIDVECYVLNDSTKSAVISQRGMGLALGLKNASGKAFPTFAQGKAIASVLGVELLEKISNPLIFKTSPLVAEAPPANIHGYDVTILIDVCKAIVKAHSEGKLLSSQSDVVKQAQIILNASAKAGIKGLVYALAGYDATKQEIIAAFKLYVREEAREYEKEFPSQLYEQWYRLYKLPKPERNKPWKFKHLTVNHVYYPLAHSRGKIHELVVLQRESSNERWKRLHQFLADVGVKALRQHLGQLLGIAQVSKNEEEYERYVQNIFGAQLILDL